MAKTRKQSAEAVALSGGKDSAYLAYLLLKQGRRIFGVHVDTGFFPKLALQNARRVARRLGIPLYIVQPRPGLFEHIYRTGLCQLRNGENPFRCICVPCSRLIHKLAAETAGAYGAQVLWVGVGEQHRRHMPVTFCPESFAGVEIRYMDGVSVPSPRRIRRELHSLGLLKMRQTSPLFTNCYVNALMIDECVRAGRGNPYSEYLADGELPVWAVHTLNGALSAASRFRLLSFCFRNLRRRIEDTPKYI